MSIPRVIRAATSIGLVGLALAGCQSLQTSESFLGVITPYRVEVVQGNVVTSEQVALAKPGLTRAQVRDVLGSPLLADPFHADRWDYVFTIRRQGAAPQLRRVVVRFKDDVLASIEGGADLPSERDFVASIDTFKTSRNAPPLVLTEEQV
jgi:outer membrane protein assembly factor BamE